MIQINKDQYLVLTWGFPSDWHNTRGVNKDKSIIKRYIVKKFELVFSRITVMNDCDLYLYINVLICV